MLKNTFLFTLVAILCVVAPLWPPTAATKSYLVLVNELTFKNSGLALSYNEMVINAAIEAETIFNVPLDIRSVNTLQPDALKPFLGRYDLIIAVGDDVGGQLARTVAAYPTQKAALINYDGPPPPPNACAFQFNGAQGAYLAGFIAARVAPKDKPLGFIGGMPFPKVQKMRQAFAAGAKRANPTVTLREVYVNNFFDIPAGKAAAEKLYDEGVAVIFHAAGQSGHGVIEAAAEKKRLVIGMDADQYALAPQNVLTSVVINLPDSMLKAVQFMEEDAFPEGAVIVMDLKSLGVHLGNTANVPPKVLKEAQTLANDIINGKVTMP